MKVIFILTLILISKMGFSQTLKGEIYDLESGLPLVGATIKEIHLDVGATADSGGGFILQLTNPGVYSFEVRFLGYNTKNIIEIDLKKNDQKTINFYLTPDFNGLDSLVISEKQLLVQPGKLTITEEQLNRFAASYYDPARMMTSSPDVLVANDQNNQVSVRGIDPSYNVWRLEGAEILNPNHLTNAGTFSDQATSNGGGVNILSAQMMDRSSFDFGAFAPELGNSVGGIFNMSMKRGSTESNQVIQASLIGFDIASEGSVLNNPKMQYAANYRYSFTGLLSEFGVDFGGEKIGFQDLSFSTSYKHSPKVTFNLFGLGGLSFNRFSGLALTESEDQKDRSDIDYTGRMGAIGASFNYKGIGLEIFSTLLISANQNIREQGNRDNDDLVATISRRNDDRQLISHRFDLNHYSNGNQYSIGFLNNFYGYELASLLHQTRFSITNVFRREETEVLIQPYVNFARQLTSRLFTSVGLVVPWNINGELQYDPRFNASYQLASDQTFSVGIGRYSQLLNPDNYYFFNPFQRDVRLQGIQVDYDFISSWRYVLSYAWQSDFVNTSLEGFYYYFANPKVENYNSQSASTSGLTINFDKPFNNEYYVRFGATLFSSMLEPNDVRAQFDNGFSTSMAMGKEWKLKSGKETSLNLRGIYQGGAHYPERFDENFNFMEAYQTQDYLRFDLRWQLVNYHAKWTSTFSIDIQNVLNRENEAFRYFDSFTNQIETQYQLGMIPILTYRVEL